MQKLQIKAYISSVVHLVISLLLEWNTIIKFSRLANMHICMLRPKYFRDTSAAQYIHLKAASPAEAKKVGRRVKNFDPNEWFNVSYNIMTEINREKYKDANLRQSLLLTGNRELVECNGKDQIWGIGLYNSSELIYDKSNWKGLNLLGRVLMEVRNELREEVYQEIIDDIT